MALKLIRESVDFQDIDVLLESKDGEKVFKIRGPFVQSEILNNNRRIYPKSLCEREIQAFMKNRVARKDALGEYQHPESPLINRERAAILIESLVEDGNNYIGTAKVLKDWPMGRLVFKMLEEGIPTGVSTRGLGTVNESTRRVNDDFKLITVDVVDTPSAPHAWVDGILESKNFLIEGDSFVEVAVERLQKNLAKHGSKEILNDLKQFLKSIK